MQLSSQTVKRASIALLVGLLITTAGCTGLSDGGAGNAANESVTNETTQMAGTETSEVNTTAAATTTPTETAATTTESTESDDDSHSHEDDSTANTSSPDAEYVGQMAVMVAGDRVDLEDSIDSEDPLNMSDVDTYTTNESVTLSEALSAADVEATESTLAYDGETFDESENGTEVYYRVDSHEVDPEEYTLEPGDEIWVLVVSDDSNVTTPGEYIPPENLHVHGNIDFTVNGEQLDFSRDKYQQAGHNDHFHFEGGHANPWHAHSAHVTLGYAMSTLDGINMTGDAVTYNETTYPYDGENGTVTIEVNGDPVNPSEYYLKDGDSVSIEIESDN